MVKKEKHHTVSPEINIVENCFFEADVAIATGVLPDSSSDTFHLEYDAVGNALRMISNGDIENVAAVIKLISYNSPFSQWKLLIKGMCTFYTGDDHNAELSFSKIIHKTIPGRIAKSYLALYNYKKYLDVNDNQESALKNSCYIIGFLQMVDVIPRAQVLWSSKKYRESFLHIVNKLQDFPALGNSIESDLSSLYFNIFHHLEPKLQQHYLESLYKIAKTQNDNTVLKTLYNRMMAIHVLSVPDIPDEKILSLWESFINNYQSIAGEDKYLVAQMYYHIGVALTREGEPVDPVSWFMEQSDNPVSETAIKCLKRSIEVQKNENAYLALLKYLRKAERKKEYNTLLGDALKQIQNSKELLCEAGLLALNKNASSRSVQYLEKAFQLDPIDKKIREDLACAYTNAAFNSIRGSNGADKMRLYFKKAEMLCPAGGCGFDSEIGYFKIRKSAMEYLTGNTDVAAQDYKSAYTLTGDTFRLLVFSYFVFRLYNVPFQYRKQIDMEMQERIDCDSGIDRARNILDVISYVQQLKKNELVNDEIESCLQSVYKIFTKSGFEDRDIRHFVAISIEKYMEIAKDIVAFAVNKFPDDPLYRYYKIKLNLAYYAFFNCESIMDVKKKYEDILADAVKKSDPETVQMIRKELEHVNMKLRDRMRISLLYNINPPV